MRKVFLIGMALLACLFTAGAREASDSTAVSGKDRLEKLEELADKAKEKKAKKADKVFNFNVLERFGWGCHMPDGNFSERIRDNYEIWFNAFDLCLNASGWMSITAGLDLKWDRFVAGGSYYLHPDALGDLKWDNISVQQADYPAAGGDFKQLGSQVNLFSLSVPAALDFHASSFVFRAGAEFVFPVTARQKENAKYGNTSVRKEVKGVETAGWYYAPFVEVGYDGVGIYCKYIPNGIIPGIVDDVLTVGLVCGF